MRVDDSAAFVHATGPVVTLLAHRVAVVTGEVDDGGTGYGLAIVREVVEAHGWSVYVGDSDEGTRFEFTGVPVDESP